MFSREPDAARAVDPPGPAQVFSIEADDDTRLRLMRWHAAYGDVYRVSPPSGGPPQWVIHDPEIIQHVLVRAAANYRKGAGLARVKVLLGNGIMVSEGDFWARQRRVIQPAFRPRALADFNAMIYDENIALAQRWSKLAAASRAVDVAAYINESTLIIVLKSIFGGDYATLLRGGEDFFALLTKQSERNLEFAARFRRLTRVVDRVIQARRAAPDAAPDFLGRMLAARGKDGEPMGQRALVDEVMTLIVAGHETTASALAWAWYLLATHADARARLQAEADALDEAALRETGGSAMTGLAYTDCVIKEVLRLYPPGWLLSRRAKAAGRLGMHGIAAGEQVFISPYIVHRHAPYWRAPERFDPARFQRAGQPAHRFAYLPFAAGPRHCVGEHLAFTEMRVHLACLMRRFTPRYGRDLPPAAAFGINLRPVGGVYLQLAPR